MDKKIVIGISIFVIVAVAAFYFMAFKPSSMYLSISIEDWVSLQYQEPDEPTLDFHVVVHTKRDNVWLHNITVETYVALKNGSQIEAIKRPQDTEPKQEYYIQLAGDKILCRRYVNASYIDISTIKATLKTNEGIWTTTWIHE